MDRKIVWSVVLSVLGTLAVLALAFLWLVYSGEYNVAATKPHYGPVAWALETTMEHSVRDHAEGIDVPPLGDSAQLRTGFRHFQAMCVTCHGAPGVERSEIGKGVLPEPPPLSEAVPEWTPAQLFWIVKHGIKMSGMPAFGSTHDDKTLWGIVAFLEQLPQLDSAEYALLRQRWGGDHAHEHGAAAEGPEHDHTHGGGAGGHEHGGGGTQEGAGTGGHEHQDSQGHSHEHGS